MFEMKHLIVVLLVVLLVFGAKKLRTIGSDLGAAVRGFKQSVNEGEKEAAARSRFRPRPPTPSSRIPARARTAPTSAIAPPDGAPWPPRAKLDSHHVRGPLSGAADHFCRRADRARAAQVAAGCGPVGRWLGNARAMARQFRDQLEEEAQNLQRAGGRSRRPRPRRLPRSHRSPPRQLRTPPRTDSRTPMSEEPEKLAEGTLISHLLELRSRLIRALAAVGAVLHPLRLLLQSDLHLHREAAARQAAQGRHADRNRCHDAVHDALQAVVLRRALHRDALRALSGVGVRRPRPVPAREALRRAAHGLLDRALLRRGRIRLRRRVSR